MTVLVEGLVPKLSKGRLIRNDWMAAVKFLCEDHVTATDLDMFSAMFLAIFDIAIESAAMVYQ